MVALIGRQSLQRSATRTFVLARYEAANRGSQYIIDMMYSQFIDEDRDGESSQALATLAVALPMDPDTDEKRGAHVVLIADWEMAMRATGRYRVDVSSRAATTAQDGMSKRSSFTIEF